jgi:tRNA (guanine-N7-)-methyltransferase
LTHPNFLQKYKGFLKDEAEVWFKTDDQSLFQDSLHYFQNTGFTELDVTDNLDQRNFVDHIMTEYEEKFINQGVQIKFARFKHTPNNSGRLDER